MEAGGSCVLVLCGLPGAGKSTLARQLQAQAPLLEGLYVPRTVPTVHVVSYDDHVASPTGPVPWRQQRAATLQHVAGALHTNTVCVVDDNMHYRRMRQQCYSLAAQRACPLCLVAGGAELCSGGGLGGSHYVLVYVQCAVGLAVARDSQRPSPVGAATIQRLASQLEAPDPSGPAADRDALWLDAALPVATNLLRVVEALRATCSAAPLQPARPPGQGGPSSQGALHGLDVVLRQHVARRLAALRAQAPAPSGSTLATAALRLNMARLQLLAGARQAGAVPARDQIKAHMDRALA